MSLSQLPVSAIFLYSIAAAAVLIYLPYLLVAYARALVGYDLSAPRAMFDKLPPYAQRATWAHQNSFEAFMIFAAAALMAYVTGVNSPMAANAAIAFVTARLLYSIFYILNIPLLRSLMFGIGSFGSGTLIYLSITQATSSLGQ
ncbi:MAPEG family protein [Cylindrospermum sp. FACHB-282]|uniref:MAPEG family protein n=1 Tax=Cylindrospermum sp. FACHB-282 TaxID=2692794 RepID=UPI00168926F5|nr:MAPEG family protein [Cylindrospermum sp. FACHB-282]MBD2386343.1 MAPEG family protein [Cylindrospermum sp. FACHB-282]